MYMPVHPIDPTAKFSVKLSRLNNYENFIKTHLTSVHNSIGSGYNTREESGAVVVPNLTISPENSSLFGYLKSDLNNVNVKYVKMPG
jgi:hypothetical protein